MSDTPKRLRVLFSGRVQGVGFRYTVKAQCTRIGVGGWVRNLLDGRVEAVLEGSAELLDRAVTQIESERRNFITRTWTEDLGPAPSSDGAFRIEQDA